jgi:sec-independent protein translocase protein TatA
MLGGIGAPELIIILVIVLVLFGPKRLPELGKSLGKTMKALREGAEGKVSDDDVDEAVAKSDTSAKVDASAKSDAAAKKAEVEASATKPE